VFIELPEVGWLVLLLLCHYLPCIFFKSRVVGGKSKTQAIFSLTCVSKVMFLGFCGQSISSYTVLNHNRKDVILIM